MRELLLLRHAKSSWDDRSLADRDRPLAPRGERAAPAMARWMAGEGLLPDRVLCSPAVRTWRRTTSSAASSAASTPRAPGRSLRAATHRAPTMTST